MLVQKMSFPPRCQIAVSLRNSGQNYAKLIPMRSFLCSLEFLVRDLGRVSDVTLWIMLNVASTSY